MTTIVETAAAAVVAVLLFDLFGALAARKFGFAYGALAIPSLVVFLVLGLCVQSAVLDARVTAAIAGIAALGEATLGNLLVQRIGPRRAVATRAQLVVGSLVGVIAETAIAFVGATWLFAGAVWWVVHQH